MTDTQTQNLAGRLRNEQAADKLRQLASIIESLDEALPIVHVHIGVNAMASVAAMAELFSRDFRTTAHQTGAGRACTESIDGAFEFQVTAPADHLIVDPTAPLTEGMSVDQIVARAAEVV